MKVRLRHDLLVLTAESDAERASLAEWATRHAKGAFLAVHQDEQTVCFHHMGPQPVACREPINVTSRHPDSSIQLISNLAHTPFEFDGRPYASVEAFWQGLKSEDPVQREAIAPLFGHDARRAGLHLASSDTPTSEDTFTYNGRVLRVGTYEHWKLMRLANWAKFHQHEPARAALLATAGRPLEHKTRRDSRTIPGAIMAGIWMHIRHHLLKQAAERGDS